MVVVKPLLHNGTLCIALHFNNNKHTEAVVRSFDGRKFSITHRCWYVPFTETTLAYVLEKVQTVDTVMLADNKEQNWPAHILTATPEKHEVVLPDSFLETLIRLRYSTATQMNYCAQFKAFLTHIAPVGFEAFGDTEINQYLHYLVTRRNVSRSTQNQAINAIKFYLEHVKHGERKVYYVDRPLKELKLPTVLSEAEIQRLLFHTHNIKHKCLLLLLYSGGLRISEVLKLTPVDIDVDRKVIYVRGAKGNKDRITLLSAVALV